jgi:hypothetical protein
LSRGYDCATASCGITKKSAERVSFGALCIDCDFLETGWATSMLYGGGKEKSGEVGGTFFARQFEKIPNL